MVIDPVQPNIVDRKCISSLVKKELRNKSSMENTISLRGSLE